VRTEPSKQAGKGKQSCEKGVKMTDRTSDTVVFVFDDAPPPRPLSGLPTLRAEGRDNLDATIDGVSGAQRRLVVVGDDAHLATVLTRLLRTDRLDTEVGYAPRRRTPATRAYRLPAGQRAARRARRGTARRVPLIRDETGSVVVGRACWQPAEHNHSIRGEAVVDDSLLFDGEAPGVWIEPTSALPGLRAALSRTRAWPFSFQKWISGRAAQLGTTGAAVVRDGVAVSRPVRRSTFYRNVEGWLLVR
jgi:hypothetical protein